MIEVFYTIIAVLLLVMMAGENEGDNKRTYFYAFSVCVLATIAFDIIRRFI